MSEETNYGTGTDYKQILGAAYRAEDRGAVLADFFEISEKAKEGGMGNVYFCRDKRDNRFYVLKTYLKPEDWDVFKQEAILTLKLTKHPYVVYTRTIVSDKDNLYIVMEYIGKQPYSLEESVQGETLTRVMNKTKLEPKQALIWALQFCQGMDFLYKSGIKAHKDIKPDNILITPENNIKIADFSLSGLDKKGGTIGYRAPEYFKQDAELTIQSDIYSFGLVLYQMLNGGKSLPNATIWDQSKKEYEHIQLESITSSYCKDIIQKCLAPESKDRYKNFEEIEKDISQEMKHYFLEYKFRKSNPTVMTGEDYLFKGIGFYMLLDNCMAEKYFSQAICQNPALSYAYYFRSLIFGYDHQDVILQESFGLLICMLMSYLLIPVIYICAGRIWGKYCSYTAIFLFLMFLLIQGLREKKFFCENFIINVFVFIILCPLYFTNSYWSMQSEKYGMLSTLWKWGIEEKIWVFLGLVGILYFAIFYSNRNKIFLIFKRYSRVVLERLNLIFQLLFLIPKSSEDYNAFISSIKTFLRTIVYISDYCFLLITLPFRSLWKIFIITKDKDKALQLDQALKYLHTVSEEKISYQEKKNALEHLYSLHLIPADLLFFWKIKIELLTKNRKEIYRLCEEFEKNFSNLNSVYLIPVLFIKLRVSPQNSIADLYRKILQIGLNYRFQVDANENWRSNLYALDRNFQTYQDTNYYLALLVLLAHYELISCNKADYSLEKAELYFYLEEYEKSLNYYSLIQDAEFANLQKKANKSLAEFEKNNSTSNSIAKLLKSRYDIFNINNLYYNMGICQYNLKKNKQAFINFNKDIALFPQRLESYEYRAKVAGLRIYKGMFKDAWFNWWNPIVVAWKSR